MDSVQQQITFGFLAVASGKLTQEQLAIALQAWYSSGETSLPDVIASQFRIDKESIHQLLLLSSSEKERGANELDLYATLAPELATRAPMSDSRPSESDSSVAHRADSTQIGEPSLFATIGVDETTRPHARSVDASPNPKGPRYEVVRAHAKGGLGEVFVARDRELQREVALKEIQLQHATDPECRSRFVLEAQVTGSLEHPGIVPVYSLGEHDDGRLYYAMRFIQGQSLKEAIDHSFRDVDKVSGALTAGRPTVAFRKLLNRFVHLCNAVGFAHSRGVLHRDIKPANVMLGKYDETLLVDWGLAKLKGRTETQRESQESTEQTLKLKPTGDSSATQLGTLVGTPAFMSPEQASGDVDAIGPASDIYSLGATLYYLLTGKPPFSRDSIAVMLKKVQAGDFPPPSLALPTVPKSLEAICLKSMASRACDRYPTASALAEDIERWLADEPVEVHRETQGERMGRWMRRNRSLITSALVALSLISLVSIASFLVVNAARSEAVQANSKIQLLAESERKSRELAETNASLAVENAKKEQLAKLEAEQLKSNAERSAANANESAERAFNAEQLTKAALAKSEKQLVEIQVLAHDKTIEAEKSKRLSSFLLSLFEASDPVAQGKGIFVGKPTSVNLTARELLDRGAIRLNSDKELIDLPLARAEVLETIGDVYRQLGAFAEAKPILEEALELRRTHLGGEHPDVAECLHDLGSLYHEQGDYEKGLNYYTDALAIRRKVEGEEGERLVANTLHNLAWMMGNEGDCDKGKALFLEAAKIREKVLGPTHRDTVFSHVGAAFCSLEQDKWLEAIPKLVWAQRNLTQVADNQNVTKALITFGQALLYQDTVGPKVAEASFREAYRLTELEMGPDNIYTALTRFELGNNQLLLENYDEAMLHFEYCLKVAREAVQMRHPRVRALIVTYSKQLKRLGKKAEGEALWNEFLTAQKSRFGDHHRFVYEAMISQAAYLRNIDRHAEAIKNYEVVEEGLPKLDFPTQPWLLALAYCEHCSILCEKKEDFQRAEKMALAAISIFEKHPELKKGHPIEWTYIQCDLGESYMALENPKVTKQLELSYELAGKLVPSERFFAMNYVMSLQTSLALQNRDYQKAEELCLQRKKHCRNLPSEMIDVAGDLMRCVALVEGLETISVEEKESLIERLDSEAIDVLKAAFAAGWKNKKSLRNDKRFTRLRNRESFVELTQPTK